jgi:phage tail-like protein
VAKLVDNLFIDQLPGELKVKIKFTTPNEYYDSIYIYRRTDKYENANNNLIDTESLLIKQLNFNDYGYSNEVEIIDDLDISSNIIYYYSVLTKYNNVFYTSSLTQQYVPVTELIDYENILWNIQPDVIKNNDNGDMKKFIKVLAKILEYIHGQTKSLELLFDINKMPLEILNNIANQMGWKLDSRLPLDIQRNIVSNITYFYKWSGSREGLDRLVKFYSGYPDNTGVIEGSSKLLFSPRFIDGQVSFSNSRCPDFETDNFLLIGTPEDPLFYCYDFKDTSRFNLTQSFTIYFRKPQGLSQSQVDNIISILNDVLEENSPLGVNFDIIVY